MGEQWSSMAGGVVRRLRAAVVAALVGGGAGAGVLTGVGVGIGVGPSAAFGQCPTDFTPYITDKPDDLAPGNNVVFGAFDVPAFIEFDFDGSGPQAPTLIAAIHYIGPADCANQFTISSEWTRLDRFDIASGTWVPLTPRFDGFVSAMEVFDEDASGPNPPRLYIGGRFGGWSGIVSPNIMRFDGTAFSAVRAGLNGPVWCMRVHDDDGPAGSTLPKLYIGGQFSAAPASSVQGQINSSGLIRLTSGLRWENPGSSFNDTVFAMTSFDDDGPGGSVPKLAVGGAFTSNNSATARLVAVWDGSTWGTFGEGLNPLESWPTPVRRVFAMTEFDEDGAGPLRPSLFVGGSMQGSFDGVVSPYVIRWRRDATTGVGTWLSVPLPPGTTTELGGNFCLNFCTTIPYEPVRLRVLCMASFDLDGTGPAPTELYIGGAVNAPSTGGQGLMKWNPLTNTTSWVVGDSGRGFADAPSPWPGGVNLIPYSMRTTPPTPSVPGRLLISSVNTLQSVPVTCTSCPPAQGCPFSPINITTTWGGSPIQAFGIAGSGPAVTNQPDNTWVTLATSTSAGFAVTVSGSGPFTYQWRKDGVNLSNGASQGFGAVLGATGPATILGGTANPINLTSQGWYDVRVSNACGTGFSTRAWLVVQPDATPYFPIRFDAAVAPVTTPIGNATMSAIAGTTTPWPRFYSVVTSTPFAIAPTGNNTWRGRLAAGSPTGNRSVTIPVSRFGVGEVYTLLNTDGPSSTSVRFTFSATGGLSYTTTLAGGNQIRSFSHIFGPQSAASVDTSTVYDNGLLRMDKQRILLPNAFRSQTLTSITITDLGTDTTGRAILGGLTLRQRPLPCGPSDIAGENQTIGSDGATTADDIIVFLGWYFSGDLRADVAGPNQSTTPDGQFTADDIIVFLGRYFAGC